MSLFNQFKLQTPESVELEFTLAGIGSRIYALVIDFIVLGLILIFLLIIGAIAGFIIADIFNDFGVAEAQVVLWTLAIQFLLISATYVGYFVFFETLWQGQTPGKRFAKIRVIQDNGKPIKLQQATLRALLRPIDDMLFLGVFFITFGKREKRIGDWVAGTLVIEEEQSTAPASFCLSQEASALADKLQIEADISRLLPEDFAVIRKYLQRREQMFSKAQHELSRTLAEQIKDIIALREIPEGITANLFLEAVYLAYQHQFRKLP